MAMDDVARRVVHMADGTQRNFPFAFTIFADDQVEVYRSTGEDTEELVSQTEYTVTFSETGGTVKFDAAPEEGAVLAIVSAVPYVQPMALTNYGGFNPETLNDNADLQEAQIQQVKELASRHLTVPATSDKTPQQVMNKILGVAKDAQKYADEAKQTLEEAKALKDVVVQQVTAEGDTQVDRVEQEGDAQVNRVEQATDWTLVGYGLGCQEEVWTAEEAIAEGAVITLPNSMKYIVGHHHLRLSYNGAVLMKPNNFEEIGEVDHESTTFRIKFPVEAGDELMAWTVPLGRGDTTSLIARVETLDDALADLSQRVVYRDENLGGNESNNG